MQIILHTFLFIIGILLGSFFTLAIYRLPKKQDILYTRSYCPKCGHKLEFIDLIPILSYLFLRGKCRHCKEKIKPRYIIIEIVSGLIYLLFMVSFKIDILSINVYDIILMIISTFLYAISFITIGIDVEKNKISNGLCYLFYVFSIITIVYACILKKHMYAYAIFAIFIILSFIAILKNKMRYKHE